MSVAQMFPKTVEEFMEEYKMVDKDHVYSNGIEYVPIFRMKQWFEHISSVHSKLSNNSPKLEKEIGECNDCIKHGGDWECDRVHCHKGDAINRQKAKDAIDIALDRIDHVPPWVYDNLLNALNEVPSVQPTHPTFSNTLGALDCVERQAAMKIRFSSGFDHDGILFVPYRDVEEHLKKLPSVPRKGKWIDYSDEGFVECPFCHSATNCDGNKDELHYCFSCGAELR